MTTVVVLPNGACGLSFKGSPPCVQSVAADSPVRDQVDVGMYVHGFVARKKDVVYSGIGTATELGRLLHRHVNDVRVLVLNSKVDIVVNHSMTTTISLPKEGSLGVVFTGSRISDIRVDSPLELVAAEGMFVHALSAPGIQYLGIASAEEIKERLMVHKGESPRKMVLSHRPTDVDPMIKITLPAGPLLFHFKDSHQACVLHRIEESSPFYGRIKPGMRVATFEALQRGPQKAIRYAQDISSRELENLLKISEENERRVLTLVHCSSQITAENEVMVPYPTPEDVAMTLHQKEDNGERLGRDTAAAPENRIGRTVDFCMRTGLEGFAFMEDAYHFDDPDGNPFMKRNFRFVEYPIEGQNGKDSILQDGSQKICCVADYTENGKHSFEILAFHARLKGLKSTEKKWGMDVHKWAIIRDRSWKDQIDQREIAMWNGKAYVTEYVIRNLELSKHHLTIHTIGAEHLLLAVLFRRDYRDGTERHKWVVSLAPGVDPCFLMTITSCLDRLIVH